MKRNPISPLSGLSRRAILGRGAIVAAALGFGGQLDRADAQEATPDAMASHPIVGTWYVSTPAGPALATFFADGTNIQGLPATQAGPNGVEFVSTQVGRWKPEGERGVHFTGVQLHSDANGTLIGTVTIDAHPVVSEDGQTLLDENPQSGPIIRDAEGNLIADLRGTGGPPAMGVRMDVGAPGIPEGTPTSATPTS
jgi:hypothetical protein